MRIPIAEIFAGVVAVPTLEPANPTDIGGIDECRDGGDDGILHAVRMRGNLRQVLIQRDDGVGHHLARSVRSDVTTTIRCNDLRTRRLRIANDMRGIGATTKRDGCGMLEDEDMILSTAEQGALKVIGLAIGHAAQVPDLETGHQSCAVQSWRSSSAAICERKAAACVGLT